MLLNRFFINVLIRVLLIVLSGLVLGIALQHLDNGYYYALAGIIFLIVFQETGKGLLDFVDKYRSLTSLPKPNLSKFTIGDLFRKCKLLMESSISDEIKISISVYPDDISIVADYAQIEQILINLIKNAAEAISGKQDGTIHLKAFFADNCPTIQVKDNGSGISGDITGDIFMPFFTTKENGSGIGLSLSKQIMQNHDGTISVDSAPDKGSVFTLKFKL